MERVCIRSVGGYILLIGLLVLGLLGAVVLAVTTGVAGGGLQAVISRTPEPLWDIIWNMRFPRVVAALLTGASFALAGAIMQLVTHNPLVDSGLLGINSGAGLAVAFGAAAGTAHSYRGSMLHAFCGAAIAVFLVIRLGNQREKQEPALLVLSGSAIAAFLTAVTQAIALAHGLSKSLSFWTAGSLSGMTWPHVMAVAPWLCVALLSGCLLAPHLSILSLGNEMSRGLGINLPLIRTLSFIVVFALAGGSVSLVGGISFIGLIVPHAARFMVGHRPLRFLPVSILLGALLLVLADVAARTVNAPFDTPVGALVSLLGVPIFLVLLRRAEGTRTL